MTTKKRARAQVRVRSQEQVRGGYGLEFQEQDIRTFCERNNLNLIRIFRDEGYSGATANRPDFQEIMEWAREKRFDVLVVWKLDRLFRDTRLTLQTIDELASLDIEFRSVSEAFTHDSNGRFLLTIFAAGAEKERKDIAMRISAERVISAKKGTWINGGVPPYGYRYNRKTKQMEIEEYEARVVKQIFHWLVDEKLSLFKIQGRLNEMQVPTKFDDLGRKKATGTRCWWGKRTIGRILRNDVYTGTFAFREYKNLGRVRHETNLRPKEDWITVKTPAVVSEELFRKAEEQLRQNAENSLRRTKTLYLFRKLVVCGHDGQRMQAARRRRANPWQECKYYFCSGIRRDLAARPCPSRSVSESRIAPSVWNKLKELLTDPRTVLQQLADDQAIGVE